MKGVQTVPQTMNPYAYGINGPLAYPDPNGRFVEPVTTTTVVVTLLVAAGVITCDVTDCIQGAYDYIASGPEPEAGQEVSAPPGPEVVAAPNLCETVVCVDNKPPVPPVVTATGNGGGPNYPDPKFAKQLERQLDEHGPASINRALRSLEKRLAEHQEKLSSMQRKSSVEREIRAFDRQIETIKQFKVERGID